MNINHFKLSAHLKDLLHLPVETAGDLVARLLDLPLKGLDGKSTTGTAPFRAKIKHIRDENNVICEFLSQGARYSQI